MFDQTRRRLSIVVLTGPTGSGKSGLAVSIAKTLGGEIINADSVQIYRGFDIGSAKPTAEEQGIVPHHLLSVVEPAAQFDVSRFCGLAKDVIASIDSRKRVPIVVGGTGMYIAALLGGLVDTPEIVQSAITALEKYEREGGELHAWLHQIDPNAAAQLSANDLVRIRRALLVYLSSGSSLATLQLEHQHSDRPYRALVICLLPDRVTLYQQLDRRVDEMLRNGMEQEVELLRERFPDDCKPFQSIGYRHLLARSLGDLDFETAVDLWKRDTRRFAKRQLTWWRNQPGKLGWFNAAINEPNDAGVENTAAKDSELKDTVENNIAAFLNRQGKFQGDGVFFLPVDLCALDNF